MPAEVLSSWKEIAAYLGRGWRTVQRWEKELRLPVRRLGGRHRGTVFAWPRDIETWLQENRLPAMSEWTLRRKRPVPRERDTPIFRPAPSRLVLNDPQLLELISEHGSQSFAVFDREMRYIHASRRWITEHGLEDIEITGLCHYDLLPEIPQHWRTHAVRCLAGETASGQEDSYLRPDGRRTSSRWALYPWHKPNGEVGGLVLFVDRTDAVQRVTQALLESEERYRALLGAAGLGVLVIGADAVIQECNSEATQILGFIAEDLIGTSALDPRWQIVDGTGEHFGGEQCPAVNSLRTGKPQSRVVMGVRRGDGRVAWIKANCQPLFHPGNSIPYCVMAVFSEIPNPRIEEAAG